MISSKENIADYVKTAEVDSLDLWMIVNDAKEKLKSANEKEMEEEIIAAIKLVLKHKNIVTMLNDEEEKTYETWDEPIENIVEKIRSQWDIYAKYPTRPLWRIMFIDRKNVSRYLSE